MLWRVLRALVVDEGVGRELLLLLGIYVVVVAVCRQPVPAHGWACLGSCDFVTRKIGRAQIVPRDFASRRVCVAT